MKRIKTILLDIVGVSLILAGIAIGWLPGPGFVPLFIGGLSILALNHEWARRWLHKAKTQGTNLYELLFPDNAWVKIIYDLFAVVAFIASIWLLTAATKNITKSLAIVGVVFGIGLFISNRKRLEKITSWAKKRTKNKH